MLKNLPSRTVFALVFAACTAAMGFAYFLELQLTLKPCPLCMTQRFFVVLIGVLALLAAIHGPGKLGRRVYAGLIAITALGGGGVAARHVWLQSLPEDQVPACGPSLSYMLETLPFTETLQLIFMGDGNCAEVDWTLLGFSIPQQTLALFVVLLGVQVWLLWRQEPAGDGIIALK